MLLVSTLSMAVALVHEPLFTPRSLPSRRTVPGASGSWRWIGVDTEEVAHLVFGSEAEQVIDVPQVLGGGLARLFTDVGGDCCTWREIKTDKVNGSHVLDLHVGGNSARLARTTNSRDSQQPFADLYSPSTFEMTSQPFLPFSLLWMASSRSAPAANRPKMPSETQRLVEDVSRIQINSFFQTNADVTQAECDEWATQTVGRPVRASPVQGATSYTVVAIDGAAGVVDQFRPAEDAFGIEFLQGLHSAYGPRFMPCPSRRWNVG